MNNQDHQRREGETMTAYAWFLVIAAVVCIVVTVLWLLGVTVTPEPFQ
jgi:hypothetical protein